MPGRNVTQERICSPRIHVDGKAGAVGTAGYDQHIPVTPDMVQKTTSYRSGPRWSDDSVAEDLRIFRNGFQSSDPRYDRGHEFETEKRYASLRRSESYFQWSDGYSQFFYRGQTAPGWWNARTYRSEDWPTIPSWTTNDTNTQGSLAIKQTIPTSPQANLSQFVGELFMGLPQMIGASLWRSQIQDFRAIGSEYLNVAFGWKPFISDLAKIASSLKKATSIIQQLERDSGRVVRRQFAFPESNVSTEETRSFSEGLWPVPRVVLKDGPYTVQAITTVTRRVRFSGAYSYVMPVGTSNWQKLSRYSFLADQLLGSKVTPATLWELAPWSWLVDWKLTIGDVLSNASRLSEDSLVMRWGYIMAHDKATTTITSQTHTTNLGWRVPPATLHLVTERKVRRKATPYGFGVDLASLSDSQWAILGALGLTKAPRSLR